MDELQHWRQRHHYGRPSEQTVYAGVIGIGCAIGIRKMAKISHPISESALEHTVNWYFSLDNLIAANDRVLQFMDEPDAPFRRSIAHFQRRAEIRGARRFAQCQLLVQIFWQGPRCECLYLSRRA